MSNIYDTIFITIPINIDYDELIQFGVVDIVLSNRQMTVGRVDIKNFPITHVNLLNSETTFEFHTFPYYLYKEYDRIELLGIKFIITKNTQKNISLIADGIVTTTDNEQLINNIEGERRDNICLKD